MATYYDIFGQKVQYLSSDPGDVQIGQVWYNSTSDTAKVQGFQAAAWSSGANWPGSNMGFAGTGTQSAYLKSSGNSGSPAPNPVGNDTYEYDGTSWTSAPNVPYLSRDPDSFGTQIAAIQLGGQGSPATLNTSVSYNGSTWSGNPSMNNPRRQVTATGFETTGITAGGSGPQSGSPEGAMPATESYNGSSWSNETALPSGRRGGGSVGIESAMIRVGGDFTPGPEAGTTATVEYDGTTWTSGGSVNTGRNTNDVGGAGTLTNGIIYGGGNPVAPSPTVTSTETYDGTSFSTSAASLIQGGSTRGSPVSPSTTGVLACGGPAPVNATQEFTAAGVVTQTITTS